MSNDINVNPVVGVILMVAITVILAACTAAFVFSLGNDLSEWDTNTPKNISETIIDDCPVSGWTSEDCIDLTDANWSLYSNDTVNYTVVLDMTNLTKNDTIYIKIGKAEINYHADLII